VGESRATRDANRGELVRTAMQEPLATLERMCIEAYLHGKGYTMQSLQGMSEEAARRLMIEASAYASAKLAEVETRARFVHDLHGMAPPM